MTNCNMLTCKKRRRAELFFWAAIAFTNVEMWRQKLTHLPHWECIVMQQPQQRLPSAWTLHQSYSRLLRCVIFFKPRKAFDWNQFQKSLYIKHILPMLSHVKKSTCMPCDSQYAHMHLWCTYKSANCKSKRSMHFKRISTCVTSWKRLSCALTIYILYCMDSTLLTSHWSLVLTWVVWSDAEVPEAELDAEMSWLPSWLAKVRTNALLPCTLHDLSNPRKVILWALPLRISLSSKIRLSKLHCVTPT